MQNPESRISITELAALLSKEDDNDPLLLSKLAKMRQIQYEATGDLEDLDSVISKFKAAVACTPDDETALIPVLNKIGELLFERYKRKEKVEDLMSAISYKEIAIAATLEEAPLWAAMLSNFATMLTARYHRLGDVADLKLAVSYLEKAVSAMCCQDPQQSTILGNLGTQLSRLFRVTGDCQIIERAISVLEGAISGTPENHPVFPLLLMSLGNAIYYRFTRKQDIKDLDQAVMEIGKALAAAPANYPQRTKILYSLSSKLSGRFEVKGNLQDLQRAIIQTEMGLTLLPEGHPDLSGFFSLLGFRLLRLYERTGDGRDLENAISRLELSVHTIPEDHPDRLDHMLDLGQALCRRFERTGDMKDLEKAISDTECAIESIQQDHPNLPEILDNLVSRLFSRHQRTGSMQDLERAISTAEMAVTISEGRWTHAGILDNLSSVLSGKYDRTGDIQALERAIDIGELAVDCTPEYDRRLAERLNSLGNRYHQLYERTNDIECLEMAISSIEKVDRALPEDHTAWAPSIGHLGLMLSERYERTGAVQDLERAITNAEQSVALSEGLIRVLRLVDLSSLLSIRFKHTHDLHDLDGAILRVETVMSKIPQDHPDQIVCFNDLGRYLFTRYKVTRDSNDLERAIHSFRIAIKLTPEDHPGRANPLSNLAAALVRRYEEAQRPADLVSALQYAIETYNCLDSIPIVRVQAARFAIRVLTECGQRSKAINLSKDSIRLLPLVCSRYLGRDDQQYAIRQTAGLAADNCSLLLSMGEIEQALEQLEFGRGLILGYSIDCHIDLKQLKKAHPDLADEYAQLRVILSETNDSPTSKNRDHLFRKKQNVTRQLEGCLSKIRQQEGFQNFLLGPTVEELKRHAIEGPIVVVNWTDIRSDAIIVFHDGVHAVHLPRMTDSQIAVLQEQQRKYRARGLESERDIEKALGPSSPAFTELHHPQTLKWLWYHCTKPILLEIERRMPSAEPKPRIWWIGTGVAGSLPFHAAGDHLYQTENVISRAISSYTPTIKALAYSRSSLASISPKTGKPSVLVVGMPETPNEVPLPGVLPEMEAIQEATRGSFSMDVQKYPNSRQILDAMHQADIIHFACHGFSDPFNPSESHLLLQQSGDDDNNPSYPTIDKLTVQQISDRVFPRGQTAYLSACSTAKTAAHELADESIHLASAFQVAWFGHVIASLWAAEDMACVRMARYFYEGLACVNHTAESSNRSIAEALHNAVLRIRNDEDPMIWACFVHYGI